MFPFDDTEGEEIVEVRHVVPFSGFGLGLGNGLSDAGGRDAGEKRILPVQSQRRNQGSNKRTVYFFMVFGWVHFPGRRLQSLLNSVTLGRHVRRISLQVPVASLTSLLFSVIYNPLRIDFISKNTTL